MKEVNINLNVDEINVVFNALAQQPYNVVFSLIGKLQQQIQQQINNKPEPVEN